MSFLVHQVGGAASIQFAGVMHDVVGSYTWPFTMAGLLLLPAALSSLSIREQTYAAKMQPRPASAIAFDRSPEDEVIDIQASSPWGHGEADNDQLL